MEYQQPPAQIENQKAEGHQQEAKKKADIHQESSGPSSPNIVTGDHSTVNIHMPAGPQIKQPRFREKVDWLTFTIGTNTSARPIKAFLAGEVVTPLKDVRLYVEGGVVYLDLTFPAGNGLPEIQIKHNEFVKPPVGWDRNLDESALEFVDAKGNAVFQLIYMSEFDIHLRGALLLAPGMLMVANERSSVLNPMGRITDYLPKPLFKYPSSVHRGQRR